METKVQKAGTYLSKKVSLAIWGILVLGIFSFFQTCSANRANSANAKHQKEMVEVTTALDSTMASEGKKNRELINLLFEREGYRISKRTLFDWNSVIRTVERPDDIMNGYDKQIDIIEEKIKQIE